MSKRKSGINFKTRKMALGALMCALGVVMIFLGAVTDILDLSMCAFASFICVLALMEYKLGFAFSVYFATFLLSMMIVPGSLAPFEYAAIGLYALIKMPLDRLNKIISWTLKLLYFNAVMIAGYFIVRAFAPVEMDKIILITTALLGNVTFILFDIALKRIMIMYVFRLRKRLRLDRFFADK